MSENITVQEKLRENGADEGRNTSDYWLDSLRVNLCLRCGVSNVGLMKTDNYTSKIFEDVNTQAHKSLECDIYMEG
jgi:hypothetical protein